MSKLKDLILFEDEHIIAINKPAHLASLHERHDSGQASVVAMVKDLNPDYKLCHRIDRETSGVMLIAKDDDTYKSIARQFEQRSIKKEYHAIVSASVELNELCVDLPLLTDSKRRVNISRRHGKPSTTIFNTIKAFKHFTLLQCQPLTGRLHQIRIHAASQNLPLVADELYGGKLAYLSQIKKVHKTDEAEKPLISRFALHAYQITFNTIAGKEMTIQAPYPKDFEVFVKLLNKYDLP
jgi:23S rRNA pseudouridine955/2504/2580 synthase